LTVGLDCTYAVGEGLTGVGVYSSHIAEALARAHPSDQFLHYYRAHKFLRGVQTERPPNASLRLLTDVFPPSGEVFHGLNQRLPAKNHPRFVCTFHDLFVLTAEYSTAEFRARFAKQARDAAERSARIIAVSNFTAGQVHELLGVPHARIHTVYHGVDQPAEVIPPSARERIVLHVGAVQARKNIARLVEAFEALDKSWRLVLAGSAGYGSAQIAARIQTSSARDRIQIQGYVSEKRLRELYDRAAVLAFPSLDEGFGIPMIEAMARGLPVLTSNRGALAELAGNAAALVDPASVESIAEGLRRLSSDEELRAALAARGGEHARGFTWDAAARATWDVYRAALSE
jgi:glycosyltransferase involved in cell wall biosynthesis